MFLFLNSSLATVNASQDEEAPNAQNVKTFSMVTQITNVEVVWKMFTFVIYKLFHFGEQF